MNGTRQDGHIVVVIGIELEPTTTILNREPREQIFYATTFLFETKIQISDIMWLP